MRDVVAFTIRQTLYPRWSKGFPGQLVGIHTAGCFSGRRDVTNLKIHCQRRSAKTCTKIELGELSQPCPGPGRGLLGPQNDFPVYSTVLQQARDNMQRFENCILLTRVGSFYEVRPKSGDQNNFTDNKSKLYFEHAEKYGPLLNLKVVQKKTAAGPVSMVQFLLFAIIYTSRATLNLSRLDFRFSNSTDSSKSLCKT